MSKWRKGVREEGGGGEEDREEKKIEGQMRGDEGRGNKRKYMGAEKKG